MKMVINNTIHRFFAELVKSGDVYLVWGGLGQLSKWEGEPPQILPTEERLSEELSYTKATSIEYLTQDENGDIEYEGIKFRRSESPTRTLKLTFKNNQSDLSSATIYQVGVRVGMELVEGISSDRFLLPNQVLDTGYLIASVNIPPIIRSPSVTETREVILNL